MKPTALRHRLLPALALLLALALSPVPTAAADIVEAPISATDLAARVQAEKGRVVLINFWASWCGPCRSEFPALARLRKSFSEKDLLILGISLDFDGEMFTDFAKAQQFPYPVLLGDANLMEDMNIEAIPKTLIYDRNANLAQNHDGPAPFAELDAVVKALLDKSTHPGAAIQ